MQSPDAAGLLLVVAAAFFLGTVTLVLRLLLSLLFLEPVPPLTLPLLVVAVGVVDALSRRPIAPGSALVRLARTGLSLVSLVLPLSFVAYVLERPEAVSFMATVLQWLVAAMLAYQLLPRRLHTAWRLEWL